HRQHGDLVAALDHNKAERLDEGGFPRAGRAGNAEPDRVVRGGSAHPRQQPFGRLAMILAGRFDEGDRAGQRPPVTATHGSAECLDIDHSFPHAAMPNTLSGGSVVCRKRPAMMPNARCADGDTASPSALSFVTI